MGAIRRIWTWLSDRRHQKTIVFLGSGLVIVVGAAWKLYIHFYPAKPPAPPSQVIEQYASEGGTAVIHTGKGDVYTGISPERFQTLSEELGITRAALKNFFKILQLKGVPAEEYDSTLRRIAKTYKELAERLERFSSSDPMVTALKEKAKEYLKSGDLEQAESFLNKAMVQDLEAARRMNEIAEVRMVSAAASMAEIGELKEIQLDYKEAASYYRQASESVPKGNDLILAQYLGMWGLASYYSGVYAAAEKPLRRSLMINEKALGRDHPDVAISLNNLALLYDAQGKYSEAEPSHKRSLAIREKVLGPDHPDVATSLNNLAGLYDAQGKYSEAEPLYKRSLAIREKALGPDHPDVATSLNNLALLYDVQGKYSEAEPLYKRSLSVLEKVLGPDHPNVAVVCKNMAELCRKIGKKEEAEKLEERAGRISSIQ
ncbi:MAG: tetratricopeptide repeat protein [Desulfobacteria bacterium]